MVHIKHTKGTKIVTTNESQNCTMITIFFKREKKVCDFCILSSSLKMPSVCRVNRNLIQLKP